MLHLVRLNEFQRKRKRGATERGLQMRHVKRRQTKRESIVKVPKHLVDCCTKFFVRSLFFSPFPTPNWLYRWPRSRCVHTRSLAPLLPVVVSVQLQPDTPKSNLLSRKTCAECGPCDVHARTSYIVHTSCPRHTLIGAADSDSNRAHIFIVNIIYY